MLEEYFQAKKRFYPQSVKGKFRNLKWLLNAVFLSIYSFSPFLRFNRGENAPSQAILIDLPGSRAYFFAIEIWPQEVYYLAGILIFAAVALFFVTSLFGRIWCGYACFQTVWVDIFLFFERLFQGDRNARIILDRKNNFNKFWRKGLTHLCWIGYSLFTGFVFIAYFSDVFSLLSGKFSAANIGWMLGIAGMTYLMAGFAREHVCTFMCPYARFQSAMFDNNTLIISYDEKRGEPRGKAPKDGDFTNRGHCISCNQCVVVCPTNIDIRNGLQMECIACGLCIDACDSVMEKMNLPKGLIRYDTIEHLKNPSEKTKFKIFKMRTLYYAAILLVVSALMLFNLIAKSQLEIAAIPKRNPMFVQLSNGSIRNGYEIRISNKSHENKNFHLSVKSPEGAVLKVQNEDSNSLQVAASKVATFNAFVSLPEEMLENIADGRILIEFEIKENSGANLTENVSAVFVFK
jgi:cytochrome c oxidase accessory protein FixG